MASHGGLILAALFITTRMATSDAPPVEVKFIRPKAAAPGPPPPPPPPAPRKRTTPKTTTEVKPLEIVQPVAMPTPVQPEPPPDPEPEEGAGEEGGQPGGVAGGVVGGVEGGTLGGKVGGAGGGPPPEEIPINMQAGMTRPRLPPECAPVRTDAVKHLRGLVLARYVLTTEGTVHDITFPLSVPGLDERVREALSRCQFEPVIFHGKPQAVWIVQQFRFE